MPIQRMPPNESRLSCGRNALRRKAVEPQKKKAHRRGNAILPPRAPGSFKGLLDGGRPSAQGESSPRRTVLSFSGDRDWAVITRRISKPNPRLMTPMYRIAAMLIRVSGRSLTRNLTD